MGLYGSVSCHYVVALTRDANGGSTAANGCMQYKYPFPTKAGEYPEPAVDKNLSIPFHPQHPGCRGGICVFLLDGTNKPQLPPRSPRTTEDIAVAEDSVL
ncbi:hypothetical protein HDU96_007951 [Phlyctochytrium bullatum]|nr:hypothetical protein HDU96_007951 [Phlyctochytrium bullatum]